MSDRIDQHLRRFSTGSALFAILIGLLAVLDCVLGHPILKNLSLEGYALKASNGLAALLAGMALWLLQAPREPSRQWKVGWLSALGLSMVSLATLGAHLWGGRLHPGQLIFQEPVRIWYDFGLARMSVFSATAFFLLGTGMLLWVARGRRLQSAGQATLLASVVVGLLAIVQDVYGVRLFGFASWNSTITLPGAIIVLLLSLAALCARPERGVVAEVTFDGPGGRLIRRLLPMVLGVPLLIGWFMEASDRHGWLKTGESSAVFAVLITGVFTVLIWFNARSLNRLERERSESLETRLRLAAIVDSSQEAVIGKTLDGTITSWNRAAEVIYGYTALEAIGQSVLLIVPPDRREEIANLLRQARSGHGIARFETVRKNKAGRRIQVELTVSPILDQSGAVLGVASIGRDITERKRLESELQQSYERFRQMFHASPVCISLIRQEKGIILDANETFCRITGYTRNEVIGRTALELGLWAEPECRAGLIQRVEQDGGVRDYEFRSRTKGGDIRQMLVAIERIELESVPCLLFIAADITERKRVEAERERLIQQLQQALANVKTLSGLLPICAGCKKIRDDKGYWNHVESYIQAHSGAKFSHGMCPDCVKKYYPDYAPETTGQESSTGRPVAETSSNKVHN